MQLFVPDKGFVYVVPMNNNISESINTSIETTCYINWCPSGPNLLYFREATVLSFDENQQSSHLTKTASEMDSKVLVLHLLENKTQWAILFEL